MSELSKQVCEACRADAPRVDESTQQRLLADLDGWELTRKKGVSQLVKTYRFDTFLEAMAFTNRVGGLAEAEGHHPALLTEWGRVTVRWWTHKIQGLHRNDFIMAAKTDNILL
ncbi:MAG: 4a-hydroxytetrahydrobiopterin dehydratase [Cellvibrionaceae bacterium]|nr:4a-hydroxytetrahydrobiopterin dehydratase [Cellvibrionaceae bacterium]